MRKSPTKKIEQYRITDGALASAITDGANGAFMIPCDGAMLAVICSDASGWSTKVLGETKWEHVSVSVRSRCPTWKEMDFVKRIFWRDDETVLQFHVPRDRHINMHETCLHLWKPIGVDISLPPNLAVGYRV